MSPLKKLRKFLKFRLARFRSTRGAYERFSAMARESKLLLSRIISRLFPMWIEQQFSLAVRYVKAGDGQKAIAIADEVLARKPDLYDYSKFVGFASIYWLLGRADDAVRLFQRMEARRHEVARELHCDRLEVRFFRSANFGAVGHLGRLDKYVKAEMLGIIPRCTNILVGASEEFPNAAYLRCWEKYFSRMTDPRTIALLAPLVDALREDSMIVRVGEESRRFEAFAAEVQARWEAKGRSPLLELSVEERIQGRKLLRDLGVPEGAWFVGLHVREGDDPIRDVRNSDITSYRLAIDEIANRGGWVLRMGDRSMRALPSWPNTIDYAYSGKRADWMDVFLWAEGRFFIGTGSGPQVIPTTFGKPVAIANFGPIATLVCGKDDILLPKRYWLEKEQRHLTLAERMSTEFGFRESTSALATMGVRVVDNSPEELRDLVVEMMDRLDARHVETDDEQLLQARFAEITAAHEVYPVKIARAIM
jgi:putative glycosyltransferase (TIGR04372 family)